MSFNKDFAVLLQSLDLKRPELIANISTFVLATFFIFRLFIPPIATTGMRIDSTIL